MSSVMQRLLEMMHVIPVKNTKQKRRGRGPAYNWHRMKPGDVREMDLYMAPSIRQAVSHYARRHPGWRFTCNKVGNSLMVTRVS